MTQTLYRWRVWCVTDNKHEFSWRDEDEGEPLQCPVNSSHTIDSSQNKIVGIVEPNTVKIKEEEIPVGGNYFLESINFNVPGNSDVTHSFSYPFPINIINAQAQVELEHKGDTMVWEVAPNTVIGTTTSIISILDTVIPVSSTVTDNIKVGFFVSLFNGLLTENLGRVIEVNSDNGTITVENPSTQLFSLLTPTYVRMTVRYVDVEFGEPGRVAIAKSKIGTSHLPANTQVNCIYTNNGNDQKRITFYMEYLY